MTIQVVQDNGRICTSFQLEQCTRKISIPRKKQKLKSLRLQIEIKDGGANLNYYTHSSAVTFIPNITNTFQYLHIRTQQLQEFLMFPSWRQQNIKLITEQTQVKTNQTTVSAPNKLTLSSASSAIFCTRVALLVWYGICAEMYKLVSSCPRTNNSRDVSTTPKTKSVTHTSLIIIAVRLLFSSIVSMSVFPLTTMRPRPDLYASKILFKRERQRGGGGYTSQRRSQRQQQDQRKKGLNTLDFLGLSLLQGSQDQACIPVVLGAFKCKKQNTKVK